MSDIRENRPEAAATAAARKPKVLMYHTYSASIGGPNTYLRTIMASDLKEKYDFAACYQEMAPGGLNMQLLRRMVGVIRAEKPDIVHVHGVQSEGLYGVLAARLAGDCRTVMTVHGFAHDDSQYRGVKRFLYQRIVEPLALRLSDRVYCVCRFAAERRIVLRHAGRRNAGYIYNCVPRLQQTQTREDVRAQLGIAPEDVVFSVSGRVTLDKGFDILAETVRLVRARGEKRFRLMIIGDGTYMLALREQLAEEIAVGAVLPIGQTDRVAEYLAASDAFILPSRHENLSIAVLEACSAGLPCIVSDVGGNAEIIRHGKSGFVLTGFDAADYAEAVLRLIGDAAFRRELGAFAKADIDQRFSQEAMCRRLERVYADTLDAGAKGV